MGLADQLTLARVAAVPLVVGLYISDFEGHDWWATGLFIAAMTTALRLAAIERGVVMHARDLGKLKTWSQATAAAIGDLRRQAHGVSTRPGRRFSSRSC